MTIQRASIKSWAQQVVILLFRTIIGKDKTDTPTSTPLQLAQGSGMHQAAQQLADIQTRLCTSSFHEPNQIKLIFLSKFCSVRSFLLLPLTSSSALSWHNNDGPNPHPLIHFPWFWRQKHAQAALICPLSEITLWPDPYNWTPIECNVLLQWPRSVLVLKNRG